MESKQVKQLYDYTKFHIGLYAGLMTLLMSALTLGRHEVAPEIACVLKVTLVCFAVAGACGGVIGSTVSLNLGSIIRDEKIGPLDFEWFTARWWAHLEHWAFWAGIVVSVAGFLCLK